MEFSASMREVILRKLSDLVSGSAERSDVASWAMAIIDDDRLRVTDQAVLQALKRLGSVDLPAPDRDYLYTDVDFEEWQADLLGA